MPGRPETLEQAYANFDLAREEFLNFDPKIGSMANANTPEARTLYLSLRTSKVELATVDIGVLVMTGLLEAMQKYLEAERESTRRAEIAAAQADAARLAADKDRRIMNHWQIGYVVLTAIIAMAAIGTIWFQAHPQPQSNPTTEATKP